jgi:hypothetical protein
MSPASNAAADERRNHAFGGFRPLDRLGLAAVVTSLAKEKTYYDANDS